MKQPSFADLEYANKKKTTRKERFLSEMDAVIPWRELLKLIEKKYPKGETGRTPIGSEVMLRIYFMQQWYALSDPAMEDGLYDSEAMRRFAGIGLDGVPDETTICRFRSFLVAHGLTEKLFRRIEQYMSERGLILSGGTIVDATIIHAPSSTKNEQKERDPEMKQTKKGNQWFFGMKVHIGTDTQGRTHSLAVTDAAVHDSQIMDELLHGEEGTVYGDRAYANDAKKEYMQDNGVTWRVNRKAKRGKKLNAADRSFNRKSNRTRARVEHAFGVVKRLWKYTKVRYKGLERNAAQVFSLFGLANVYLARRELRALQG